MKKLATHKWGAAGVVSVACIEAEALFGYMNHGLRLSRCPLTMAELGIFIRKLRTGSLPLESKRWVGCCDCSKPKSTPAERPCDRYRDCKPHSNRLCNLRTPRAVVGSKPGDGLVARRYRSCMCLSIRIQSLTWRFCGRMDCCVLPVWLPSGHGHVYWFG